MGEPVAERAGVQGLRRPGPLRRAEAWYVTGPVGHLVAGALDIGSLLVRVAWLRARGRPLQGSEADRSASSGSPDD